MAGSITVLPARKTGFGEFSEAFSPYLQYAFQMMMKRQLEDQQRQRAYTEAEKMGLLTKTPYQQVPVQGGTAQVSPMAGMKIPTQYKYNLQQQPGMQTSMKFGEGGIPQFGMETQKPDWFNEYYKKQVQGGITEGGIGENIVYRDSTGAEVPADKAQADIASGNPNYYIFKKEVTKSGIKETPISKPEDLQKTQQQKGKSQFIIDQAKDALNTISEIEKGIQHFGLFGQLPSIPGTERYTWETNINKLLSGKMIELMTQMKEASKTGATGFGQLSEKEGQILREASTALKRGLPPEKAQEYLNNIKTALQKVMSGTNVQSTQQPQTDLSQMSDEELRRIAGGG